MKGMPNCSPPLWDIYNMKNLVETLYILFVDDIQIFFGKFIIYLIQNAWKPKTFKLYQ